MRDMGPDAQINYSLHSSTLSRQLSFIEPVRCPLRMAWEEKCHSCQEVKKRKRAGEADTIQERKKLLLNAGLGCTMYLQICDFICT